MADPSADREKVCLVAQPATRPELTSLQPPAELGPVDAARGHVQSRDPRFVSTALTWRV